MLDTKPDLNEDLLIHFGVKGMKWGVRHKRPDEEERKAFFTKKNAKKIAIGAALIGGTAAAIYVMTKRGKTPVADLSPLENLDNVAANVRGGTASPLNPFLRVGANAGGRAPSPYEMRVQAQRFADQNLMNRIGAQKLTDKAWRDQARIQQLTREMDKTTNSLLQGGGKIPSIDQIRQQLQDPNHVWEI